MMSNAKLIKALRCKTNNINDCTMCDYHNACYDGTLASIAAEALEDADKRIEKLEKHFPKEGECEAKKPKTVKETEYSFYCDCPTCGGRLISNADGEWCAGSFDRFCRMCGQKIDWSEYCGWSNMPMPDWCHIKGELVLCGKCYYKAEKRIMDQDALWCRKHHMYVTADWFCADGDRK